MRQSRPPAAASAGCGPASRWKGWGVALTGALVLGGCGREPVPGRWLGDLRDVAVPAGPGSRYPNLGGGGDAPVVLSWLETVPAGGHALRFASWSGTAWTAPRTVATGDDWFVNWPDFPSVVPTGARSWVAHWLQKRPGHAYSYDVRIAASSDGGASWSAPVSPHDDGTATEHGFVSLFGDGDATYAVWLDGRHTSGDHDHADADAAAMTLRAAALGADGGRRDVDLEIDGRVCDCCQTDAALTSDGPVVVYRDRGADEVREIALVRRDGAGWSRPVHVHADGWRIDACPVNGPAVAARGRQVVVAWFTAPDRPRVRLAFSSDAGRSFAAPIEVASGPVAGRVDVVLLDGGRAVVSWLQESPGGAAIIAQPFTAAGAAGVPVTVAASSVARSSGFPQMARAGAGLVFAWTEPGDPPRVRSRYAPLY